MRFYLVAFFVLVACAFSLAVENGPLMTALQPVQRPKRHIALLGAGAGLLGAGLAAGAVGLGAGVIGAKAGLVGGAIAATALRGRSYGGYGGYGGYSGYGIYGHGYGGGYGYGGYAPSYGHGYDGGYRSYYPTTTYVVSDPWC
ncbi:acanthoscurrin-1-like isoform X2 [Pieris brassicae]|uniref:Uncharacterized protein n=1 Tax=Pieris brassicae TaxID=7116 RepID=A0A9P0TF85_PIEBR|nr:acanthoscurrin-1-like isoform X2 [Pieris brassicae]CAH4031257.1 unnamed protein product [Pieris brassicae]